MPVSIAPVHPQIPWQTFDTLAIDMGCQLVRFIGLRCVAVV